MEKSEFKDHVFSNFIWRFMERWGAQGVTLIVGIILARILEPEIYGTIALVTVFTTFLQVFVDSGLGMALIQKKDADDLDFSSVFWFNLCVCIILYFLVFFAAPGISSFYNRPDLIPVIRVLSLTLIISGVKNIQQAYVSRHLMFKKFFFATLGGTIGAAVVGIVMAYMRFGVWALVGQYLFNATADTIILWITVKWKPKFMFSLIRFKTLFSYGWKMLISSLIDTAYNQLRSLVIGKYYTSEDLAYYTKGNQFPEYAVQNINTSMNSVLLPVLAKKQDDIDAIRSATRRVVRVSSYIIWPMMIGLCIVADKFIVIVLTEKWLPSVIFLRILCFSQVFQPIQTTNLSVIKALGKADMHLKLELLKKTIAIIIVIISAMFGVYTIAIGSVLYAVIATVLNAYPNRKLIGYSYEEQIKDIIPFILMSVVMGIGVYLVGLFPMSTEAVFILQILVGVVIYTLLSAVTKIDTFYYTIESVKTIINRKK